MLPQEGAITIQGKTSKTWRTARAYLCEPLAKNDVYITESAFPASDKEEPFERRSHAFEDTPSGLNNAHTHDLW